MKHNYVVIALLVVIAVLVSVVVGGVTGVVSWVGGTPITTAILQGGAAAGGAMTLMLVLFNSTGLFN